MACSSVQGGSASLQHLDACPRRLLPAEWLSGAQVWLQVASASRRSSKEVSHHHLPRLLAAASQVPGQTALLALHVILRILEAAQAAVSAAAASVAAGQGQQGLSHDPLAHQAQAVLAAATPGAVEDGSKGAGVAPQPEAVQVEPPDQSLAQLAGSAASKGQAAEPTPGAVTKCQEVQLQILRQLLMFPRAQSSMPEEVRSSVGCDLKCMLTFSVV